MCIHAAICALWFQVLVRFASKIFMAILTNTYWMSGNYQTTAWALQQSVRNAVIITTTAVSWLF